MKLIFCVDTKNGLMFFGRRQSQDSVLRSKMLELTAGAKLWMSEYSAGQFENTDAISVDNDCLRKAAPEDYCFIEDLEYSAENADEIILFQWNRQYQADKVFRIDLTGSGFRKVSSTNFEGSSHPKITMEIYKRK